MRRSTGNLQVKELGENISSHAATVAEQNSKRIRRVILEQSKRAHVGHIGSALSIADLLGCLYSGGMNIESPKDPSRDRLILSKGHAALALYGALFLRGWISAKDLNTFCSDDSAFGVHPEMGVPGIEHSTGSLGQGLSVGVGLALAAKIRSKPHRVFVLLSDAECNEGSVWEAIMFAAQHGLSNLTAIIDNNGQQAFGYTKDVVDLSPMAQKWKSFGWNVESVDGHNHDQLLAAMSNAGGSAGPTAIVANTTFGKGVSFMERQIKWHYLPMSDSDYQQALSEIGDVA